MKNDPKTTPTAPTIALNLAPRTSYIWPVNNIKLTEDPVEAYCFVGFFFLQKKWRIKIETK